MSLYPLKFNPIYKDKIWGGNKLKAILNKNYGSLPNCGESWEISGVKGDVSVVKEGALKGKSLTEVIADYKERLLGTKIFKNYGQEFPLLIKFLDAREDLSIQVHPDDKLASERHNCKGKTEMWYIFQADEEATLITGFNRKINEQIYLEHLNNKTLNDILNREKVHEGDVFFIPAGRVHTIGKGICLAEIQQTSDITYRIYDFDRVDDKGNKRELHTEQALAAIDYNHYDSYKTTYKDEVNKPVNLVDCPYFTTTLIHNTTSVSRDYSGYDSFVIYINVMGTCELEYTGGTIEITKGETVLLPAELKKVTLKPKTEFKLLEVFAG